MNIHQQDCFSCRMLGRTIPWAFMIAAAVISLSSLGENWQRGAAYLVAISLSLLFGSYLLGATTPGHRKF